MIVKEKSPRSASFTDPRLAAGEEAERQMAFYLRRAFESAIGGGLLSRPVVVRIFNDVRLPLGQTAAGREDAVQIDHLVLHPWGMVIVESKSITGEIVVNSRGEWERTFGGRRVGIPSPVEQARRQAEALRQLLQDNRGKLRERKVLGLVQGGFKSCPIQILVAISDRGIVTRKGFEAPEVLKADQVAARIQQIIEQHRSCASLLSSGDDKGSGDWSLTEDEARRVTEFLLSSHTEIAAVQSAAPPAPARVPPPAPKTTAAPGESIEALTCGKCRSINVRVVHARYGYCLRCAECGGYTAIDSACKACGKKARVAKDGPEFRRSCALPDGCGAERVFFRNPDELRA
jgi:hypothetical protein